MGDARAGSVKRVASAVGEGSMAVHLVHRFFSEGTEQAAPVEPGQAALSALLSELQLHTGAIGYDIMCKSTSVVRYQRSAGIRIVGHRA